ncbi:unannotated protein [freshwater metagenome]|jgi:carbon-monoxide dehydrogenase medium subunit|uniref:Unannotated protein n=1 Tax=freshwater metagenome TaxID=449393 RepID=A0A6J7JC33_9ZZZZ|nr:xanthine dehydrogenase family protein subunit M [Actinomycetota bacterium]
MKPAAFDYVAPTSLDAALTALADGGYDAKPIAGGQSLVPLMAFRLAVFGQLVDLGRIEELQGVARDGDELVIGAATRQAAIAKDALVAEHAPVLAQATGWIGHQQIRNRGTIGGSICHADPAAEYPATAVALDATIDVASTRGRRSIPAAELFEAAYTTTLEPDEVAVAVRIPVRRPGEGTAIFEVARRPGDFALAGCVVRVATSGGAVIDARVLAFGVGGAPIRLAAAEAALAAGAGVGSQELTAALQADADGLTPPEDAQATSAYRHSIVVHVANTAIAEAIADSQ